MGAPTIPCPHCKKSHRAAGWEEAVERCKLRAEKRAAREAEKKADLERREANLAAEPPEQFVQRLVFEGVRWDSVRKQVEDTYPPPAEGERWTFYHVFELDSRKLNWPGFTLEQITMLRLEKYMTGAFITANPLQYVEWPKGTESVDHLMLREHADRIDEELEVA